MHVSLMCQTVAYVGRWTDLVTIDSQDKTFEELQMENAQYCKFSGSLQIIFETFGYVNLASYLFLLRHSVSNATADLSGLRLKLFLSCLGITLVAWLCILAGPKIGLESTLSCGVQFSSDFTEYTELARNLHIFLVPYLLWKSLRLTDSVPGFIKQSFSYYTLQVVFYIGVFAVRMTVSFLLQFASVSILVANDGELQAGNVAIKNINLLMYTVEVLVMTYMISLDCEKFSTFLSMVLCNHEIESLKSLQRNMALKRVASFGEDNLVEMDAVNDTEMSATKCEEVHEQDTDDQKFKENYSKEVLSRTTTLRLKASFHLINYIMMSVCSTMITNLAKGSA